MPKADLLAALGRRSRAAPALALAGIVLGAIAVLLGSGRLTDLLPPPRRHAGNVAPSAPAPAEPAAAVLRTRPLAAWLEAIAQEAGLGLVLAAELDGEVTATFPAGTPWAQRLAALGRVHGFAYRTGEGLIEAWAPEMAGIADTRPPAQDVYGARSVAEPDAASVPAAPAPAPEPPRVARVIRLTNARAIELVRVLYDALGSADVAVAADPAANALVAAGLQTAVDELERVARSLDLAKRSFLLEAQIIELKRSSRDERGIRWLLESGDLTGLVDFPAAESAGEQSGIIVATSGSHTLRARISALAASGKIRVISRPRVIVLEGRPASIESVRILRVRIPDRGAVVADADEISVADAGQAVEEIPVGVSLLVEPALQGQGKIVLRVRAKSSTLGPPLPPDDIPEELSRVVDTDVVVGDGETAVLGGLLRKSRSRAGSGVPVLRSIPLVGLLFGKRIDEREGEELVVLITPRLLG